VSNVTLAIVLHAALATNVESSYRDAYLHTAETGKPLVVLVGADWCPGCRTMHNSTLPQAAQKGMLKNVSYAHVNTDHDGQLARQLMQGGSIPQLIMFYETPEGWKRKQITGATNVHSLEAFLKVGIDGSATVRAKKEGDRKVAAQPAKSTPAPVPASGGGGK
jgi:thioredoxin-like negative regulator of GroEL